MYVHVLQVDKILLLVYDMDNILLQLKNEKDQDRRKTYSYLFQFLKRNMLLPKLPSLAGEKLGTIPFEKPSIAKVRTCMYMYMYIYMYVHYMYSVCDALHIHCMRVAFRFSLG